MMMDPQMDLEKYVMSTVLTRDFKNIVNMVS